jgi:predicted ATPase with chaperone activity
MSGLELAQRLGLAFPVIEPAIDQIKAQRLCEIVGGTQLGAPSYRYRITMLGRERAKVFLDGNAYVGSAPVPLDQYKRYLKIFHDNVEKTVSREQVKKAMSHLVLSEKILDQLGPAINAGHSLFVYGPPGNGKSVISQAVRNLLPGDFWIPHAIEADGSIIQVYDPVNHEALPAPTPSAALDEPDPVDKRWVQVRRPLVTVGGELELESLDLRYVSGFYRAPLQMIANGGALVIDDFGRQKCSPHALLNRWITPLEARVDYLTLQSGQKIEIPFMVLPIFATNIKPVELVDEAFLRRIHYKVFAESPTSGQFVQIFENCCHERGLKFELPLVRHLIEVLYPARKLQLRGCHPRDLIDHALSLAKYRGDPQRLTINLLEGACDAYFVDEDQGVTRA